ncbi:EAL domain-containing protein [Sideroxydans sp. CL21]|uniref:EAL domain-containing protein n=1 Tax=Sideroxydans sp. CL21 TaxID=2600596 RepID=UPI0024BC969A|nr:EAL domain-containing protein [Sideroxydans sp. CL21]
MIDEHANEQTSLRKDEALWQQKRESLYRTLAEVEPDGIFVADANGRLIDVNSHLCEMLGYAGNELCGMQVSNLVDQSDTQIVESALNEAQATVGHNGNIQLHRKDGSRFNAELTSARMPGGDVLAVIRPLYLQEGSATYSNRLAAIVEASDDAIIGKDLNSLITSWNAGAERIFGYTASEMIGTSVLCLIPADRHGEEDQILAKIRRGEKVDHYETVRLTKDQRLIDVSVTISPIKDETGAVIGASKIARDITLLKARQREIVKMSRLYAALAQINQAIPSAKTRDDLFQNACRLLVGYGELKMAWIGWHDPQSQQMVPIAAHGDQFDYLCKIKVYASDSPEGRGPTGTSFRTGRPCICNKLLEDPVTLPWRAEIKRCGFRASASFPIRKNEQVIGTLNVYVGEPDFFQEDEVLVLDEAARDISFATDNFELQDARKQSEITALREKAFSDTLIESMPGIVYLFDERRQFLRWNGNWKTVTGYSDAEISTMHPLDFFAEEERSSVEQQIADVFETGTVSTEASLRNKDGVMIPHLLIGQRIVSDGMFCLLGIGIDISARKNNERKLQEQDALFMEMSAMAHIGGWSFDPRTGEGVWTEEVALIHEVEPRSATNASFGLSFYHGESRELIESALHEAIDKCAPYDLELEMVTASGTHKWVRTMATPIVENGQVIRIRGSFQDITERKTAENRIKRLNRVLAVLSQINSLIVRVQDRNDLFREACKIATEAGGFRMSMVAMVDSASGSIVPVAAEGKDVTLMADIKQILSSNELAAMTMVARAIREKKPIVSNDSQHDPAVLFARPYAEAGINSMVVLPLIVEDKAVGVLALYAAESEFFLAEEMQLLAELTSDISFAIDHINKQERLNYLAYYDALTGLANRSLFLERVRQFIHNRKPEQKLALFLVDLERFKRINDSLGRGIGDVFLVQIAKWMADYVKDSDLLARIGEDHFAAVMPDVRQDGDIGRLVEKTQAALQGHPFVFNDAEIRISAKIGIAMFPDDGTDAETLLGNAEAALKIAKKTGDRYQFHTKRIAESVSGKLSLENQLRQAIDNEEFVLHYQPKVNLTSGKVVAAEALIRWNNPRTGLVLPGEFIPLLEETGLIFEVGRWALRKSIEDNLRWRNAGLASMRIAVNVSPLQLRNQNFVAEIKRKIGDESRAAEGLELEITESVFMEDLERNISTLQAIRDLGVTIAIDDFGTGFSSLSYLSKLPVDTLKIDRSFVVNMTKGPQGLALVSTIINLGHSLALKVVAEGVDAEEQSHLLRLLTCDEMQGFYFSKPVPAEIFEARFLSNSANQTSDNQ